MGEFDLRSLYAALDEQRRARHISWAAVAAEVNHLRTHRRPIAVSTITGLKQKPVGEGDAILQMLLWLRRTPESFVPGMTDPGSEAFCRPRLSTGQILCWDSQALFEALDDLRRARQLTWTAVARAVGGFTPNMLTNLSKGGRVAFPGIMRLVQWLDRPAAAFTRVADW
jgi:hypothetical protein